MLEHRSRSMQRWPRRSSPAVAAGALGLTLALALGGGLPSAVATTDTKLPLKISDASASLIGHRVSATAKVTNDASGAIAATIGSVAWRAKSRGTLTGLSTFSLARLVGESSKTLKLSAQVPATASAGKYAVMLCVDIYSQIASFKPSANCVQLASVTLRRSGGTSKKAKAAANTEITSGPSGTVSVTTAVFMFNATGKSTGFQCSLDHGPWVTCKSPVRYTRLVIGSHTFQVRALSEHRRSGPFRGPRRLERHK